MGAQNLSQSQSGPSKIQEPVKSPFSEREEQSVSELGFAESVSRGSNIIGIEKLIYREQEEKPGKINW